MARIGVYGGTFDPVHLGHVQLAKQAINDLGLSRLLFVPAASPPHKMADITDIKHRIAMLELVCKTYDNLQCCDIERHLPKPSYTVDTLRALRGRFTAGDEFVFVMGVDAFLDLKTWKEYSSVLAMVDIAVSPRVGYDSSLLESFLFSLDYRKTGSSWEKPGKNRQVIVLSQAPVGVCSSQVRKDLGKGIVSEDQLPVEVTSYIRENSLYNL